MTERTAAETDRPGEGRTLGEVARDGFYGSHIGPKVEPWHKLDEETQSWWQAAAEAVKATLIPCTFPSCLSAQTAATAGGEIARLKEQIEDLKSQNEDLQIEHDVMFARIRDVNGQYTPDEVSRLIDGEIAYQRGVEDERERAAEVADEYACSCMIYDERDGVEKTAIGDIIRSASPAPQKDTAGCQEVCEWVTTHRQTHKTGCGWHTARETSPFCPYCKKPVKVVNG